MLTKGILQLLRGRRPYRPGDVFMLKLGRETQHSWIHSRLSSQGIRKRERWKGKALIVLGRHPRKIQTFEVQRMGDVHNFTILIVDDVRVLVSIRSECRVAELIAIQWKRYSSLTAINLDLRAIGLQTFRGEKRDELLV